MGAPLNLDSRMAELDRRTRRNLAAQQGEDYVDIDRLAAILSCDRHTLMLAVTIQSLPCIAMDRSEEGADPENQEIAVNVQAALEWHSEVVALAEEVGLSLQEYLMQRVAEVDESIPDDLMRPAVASEAWGIDLDELSAAIAAGEIKTHSIGRGEPLVSETDVVEWMEARTPEAPTPEPESEPEPEPAPLSLSVSVMVPEEYKGIDDDTLMTLIDTADPASPPDRARVAAADATERIVMEIDPDVLSAMLSLSQEWQMPFWAVLTTAG